MIVRETVAATAIGADTAKKRRKITTTTTETAKTRVTRTTTTPKQTNEDIVHDENNPGNLEMNRIWIISLCDVFSNDEFNETFKNVEFDIFKTLSCIRTSSIHAM